MSGGVEKRSRVRASIACESCRQRKARCDAASPACENCSSSGLRCVYRSHSRTPARELWTALMLRIENLENKYERDHHDEPICPPRLVSVSTQHGHEHEHEHSPNAISRSRPDTELPPSTDTENTFKKREFNEGLFCFKQQTVDMSLSNISYAPNIFCSILTPGDVAHLLQATGDLLLWQRLNDYSRAMWRAYQLSFSQLLNIPSIVTYDSIIFERCLDIYMKMKDNFFHVLISPEDLALGINSYPEHIRNGIFSTIFIIGINGIRAESKSDVPYVVRSQEACAYLKALETLRVLTLSDPGFLEVRLCLSLLFTMTVFSSVHSVPHFLETVVAMARSLGLDSEEENSKYSKAESGRREYVWLLLTAINYSFGIHLSIKPILSDKGVSSLSKKTLSVIVVQNFDYFTGIHLIYDDVCKLLGSVGTRRVSLQQIVEDMTRLDQRLETWRFHIEEDLWNINPSGKGDIQSILCSFPWVELRAEYYHTVIAVHSFAAFNVFCSLELRRASLQKLTNAAQLLFDTCTQEIGSLSLSVRSAIAVYLAILLKTQSNCMDSEITGFDNKSMDKISKIVSQDTWPFDYDKNPLCEMVNAVSEVINKPSYISPVSAASSSEPIQSVEVADSHDECCIC